MFFFVSLCLPFCLPLFFLVFPCLPVCFRSNILLLAILNAFLRCLPWCWMVCPPSRRFCLFVSHCTSSCFPLKMDGMSALPRVLIPRTSDRRVLPIVRIYISSSYLYLLIFTPSHLHIFSQTFLSLHLLIFTSSHLYTFLSSHLLLFTSTHLHTFSHTFSYTFSHTFISSLSLTLSPLSSLLSLSPFSRLFLSFAFFIFLSLGRGWCRRGVTKREPFRTK